MRCVFLSFSTGRPMETCKKMENSMKRSLGLTVLLCSICFTAFAQTDSDETQVRKLINEFEAALAQKDIAKIESFVSMQIVVFENGYRNDGWQDFRDNHLIPEFKHAVSQVIPKRDFGDKDQLEPASASRCSASQLVRTELGVGFHCRFHLSPAMVRPVAGMYFRKPD